MFEGLSDRSWGVVARAIREARRRRDPLVLPPHLVLGLLEDGHPGAAGVLLRMGVTERAVRAPATGAFVPGSRKPGKRRGFSDLTEYALERAREFAGYTRHGAVEPPHLLAGVVHAEESHREGAQGLFEEIFQGRRFWRLALKTEDLNEAVFRWFHESATPEARSAEAVAARLLGSHPGTERLRPALDRLLAAHAAELERGEYEKAVILRGVLLRLVEDPSEPDEAWVENARKALEEEEFFHDDYEAEG